MSTHLGELPNWERVIPVPTMIPVQIEATTLSVEGLPVPQHALCGTCTKCGKTATHPVSDKRSDGTARERVYAAGRAVLADLTDLTDQCAERLSWGLPPHHYDRDIPRGVEVFQVDARGIWLLCHVEEVGAALVRSRALFTIYGACQPRSRVLVRPTEAKYAEAAATYAERLREKFGLLLARTVPPDVQPQLAPKTKE